MDSELDSSDEEPHLDRGGGAERLGRRVMATYVATPSHEKTYPSACANDGCCALVRHPSPSLLPPTSWMEAAATDQLPSPSAQVLVLRSAKRIAATSNPRGGKLERLRQ